MRKFAAVLLKQGENFLLQHRDDKPGIVSPGKYAVWGGALEGDESFEQGALRELKEETGVLCSVSDLLLIEKFVLSAAENTQRNYAAEIAVYLVEVDASINVNCYEGQGIVKFKSLADVPGDKLSFPLDQLPGRF